MTRKEAVAEILRLHMNSLLDKLAGIGLPDTFRATIVLRNVEQDRATIVFGQDDEASLIVALNILGASEGRKQYKANASGIHEERS